MKKLILSIASLLFAGMLTVNAQAPSDSTSITPQPPVSDQPTDQPGVSDDQANYTKDMELIQSSEVPASLRSTLQGSDYTGWEDGKVYRNSTTNEYLIVIGEEDAKVHRFDANGTRIEDTPANSDKSGSTDSGSGSTESETPSGSTSGSTGTTGTEPTPTPAPAPTPAK